MRRGAGTLPQNSEALSFQGCGVPRPLTSVAAWVQPISPTPARSGPWASEGSPPPHSEPSPPSRERSVTAGFVYFTLTLGPPPELVSSLHPLLLTFQGRGVSVASAVEWFWGRIIPLRRSTQRTQDALGWSRPRLSHRLLSSRGTRRDRVSKERASTWRTPGQVDPAPQWPHVCWRGGYPIKPQAWAARDAAPALV